MASRGSRESCRSTSACTPSARAMLSVMRMAVASTSCSAWLRRSAATTAGSFVSSATTSISLGPAIMSMSTRPNTCRFASATQALPGPTILSTRGTEAVPYASAATPCAPPRRNTRSTPAIFAAARIASGCVPSGPGGEIMTSCRHPASFAGIAVMSTVEGYAAVWPGTHRPTFSIGVTFMPIYVPSGRSMRKPSRFSRLWKARMFAAASSSTARNASSVRS